jgi:hypothetical protein
MRWAVFYDDGRVFASEDGTWESAPLDGVSAIAWRNGERSGVETGGDHYVRFTDDGTIAAIDLDPFLRGPNLAPGVIKFGRYTSAKRHEQILCRAREWLQLE